MRRATAGILAGLLVLALGSTSTPAPAAAVVSSDPKIVLVVGATHGMTSTYRSWMNVVATTAARYSRNVVKVYSPNATYSKVKTALQGASIVVYMGHGNGFPSPYSTTPNPYTQNGMGLNLTAGAGDSNTKYYGEYYIARDVDLAPNAVVILSHNCYASGNSEPGKAEPSLAVAKARIDNFAAGFLRAGARAVIADGHADPSWYIEQLFTTHRTIEQIWRSGPSPHGNAFTFPSVRTTGYTAFSDPDHRSGSTYTGFYRSMVAKPTLTSDQVTGARYARTDANPGFFVVPGAAEVTATDGVGLYADAALTPDPATLLAPATLPAGTRLRLRAVAGTTSAGTRIYSVATVDGATSGFVTATGLTPRDSASPRIWELDAGTGAFSPNGDGSRDAATITAAASEAVTWDIEITDGDGAVVARLAAEGGDLSVAWDGRVDGAAVPDGRYTATVTAQDGWGNEPATASLELLVDTVKPALDQVVPQGIAPAVFSPNGDGVADTVRIGFSSTEAGAILVTVRDTAGAVVDSTVGTIPVGAGSASWDGGTMTGATATDGSYTVELAPRDRAGNVGAAVATTVDVYSALGFVKASLSAFYPLDADALAQTVRFSFILASPATVTMDLVGPTGELVRTIRAGTPMAAGASGWTWDGRLATGAYAPRGVYTLRVRASDGARTTTQAARTTLDAFRTTLSDSTPGRGQLLTVTVVTSEPLSTVPKVRVEQPGVTPSIVATKQRSSTTYTATIRLSGGGAAGSLGLKVVATDTRGGINWSRFAYPLH